MTDEQHKADLGRVSDQNQFTDLARGLEERPSGDGLLDSVLFNPVRSLVEQTAEGKAVHASVHGRPNDRRTNFEKHPLNEMIDLVEQTNPEDLESSGKALWDARDAIKAAAEELSGQLGRVTWRGKSADAFRQWGGELVTQTHSLSSFAGGAGDQITAAAVGLASVRTAMPARDTQAARKHPAAFTEAEKAANKDEYATAVRVEKDRQEAINQMNRLSSYYVVSKDELAALNDKAPDFSSMSDMGVPQAKKAGWDYLSGESNSGNAQGTRTAGVANHHATVAPTGNAGVHDAPTVSKHVVEQARHPDAPVGTNIDSVGTLPPSTTLPTTGHNVPVMGTPTTGGGPTNAFENSYGTPIPSALPGGATRGPGGFRSPASAEGRAGTSSLSGSGTGRTAGRGPMNQMGRATETGRSLAKGTASGANSSPMGRGITGGTPRASGTATPRANGGPAAGAGRSNGVVGGRPTTAAGNSANGGSRIPRGNVIGAEEAAGSRSGTGGRPGQRGVFGAPETAGRSGPNPPSSRGGSTGTPETVTATPSERNSVARAERNGMTRGGSGLVRGPGNQGKPGDRGHTDGAPRPGYLVENEETHLPTQPRRDVPPVVN